MIVSLGQALAGNSPPDCCVNLFKSLLTYKTKPIQTDGFCSMAEKEGFEPSIPFWGIHDFQSCALGQLRDFSISAALCPTWI